MSEQKDPQELEAKFECPPSDLGALLELEKLGNFAAGQRAERRQTDIYFDTAGLDLRRNSSSLRVRAISDGRRRVTFKGPRQRLGEDPDSRHLVKRVEIEVDLDEGYPRIDTRSSLPDALRGLDPVARALDLAGRGRPLLPLAAIETQRRIRRFEGPSGAVLEIAVDAVVARDLRSGRETRFGEVELEALGSGTESDLRAASDQLLAAIPTLRPSTRSKLGRVLGDE